MPDPSSRTPIRDRHDGRILDSQVIMLDTVKKMCSISERPESNLFSELQ